MTMTMTETTSSTGAPLQSLRLTARALLLGDRLDVAGLERSDVLSTAPLAFRAGQEGFVALFRYGVAVLVGLTPLEEDEIIRSLRQRIRGEFARHEEETAVIEITPDRDDQIPPGGPIYIKQLSTERLIDGLWGDDPPSTARKTLHVHVSNVRRLLGVGFPLETTRAGYRLDCERVDIDSVRFEAGLARGTALLLSSPGDAADVLADALQLWSGPAYADLADQDAIRPEATLPALPMPSWPSKPAGMASRREA